MREGWCTGPKAAGDYAGRDTSPATERWMHSDSGVVSSIQCTPAAMQRTATRTCWVMPLIRSAAAAPAGLNR